LICGTPVAVSVIIMSIWPPSRSVSACGLLLYGTCRMSVWLSCLNISPATRLDELPLPKLSLPGSFFALATRIGDALVRRVGATTSTCPPLPRPVTGTKSFTGS
jgi:hypothetical protein